jgi:hypothetical protein
MNLFILYFKKAPAFFYAILFILVFELSLYAIPKLHYIDGGGAFLTTYKKLHAEDSNQSFDILMYGDSRSLAIRGFDKSEDTPLSLYNYSLPAAGARYFQYYLKKYLKKHNKKPSVIIWAADPEQFALTKNKAFDTDPLLWNTYKHRLLNLFNIYESWEQYTGKELVFIMKESLPNLLLTVKYRQGFESLLAGLKLSDFTSFEPPNYKRNTMIQTIVDTNYGGINLGDYFFGNEEIAREELVKNLQKLSHTNFHLEPLSDFLEYTKKENIQVIVLNIPRAEGLNDTPYFSSVVPAIQKEVSNFKHATYLEFPFMDYPNLLFAESIHYTTEGGSRLNKEFIDYVYPIILEKIFIEK